MNLDPTATFQEAEALPDHLLNVELGLRLLPDILQIPL